MKKGLSLVLLIIVIHLHLSKATETTTWTVVNGNNKGGCSGGDCIIGMDLESEFSFGSHVARMLYDVSQSVTGRTGNSNGASANKCPQTQSYRSCLPSQNGGGPRQRCGDYTRTC